MADDVVAVERDVGPFGADVLVRARSENGRRSYFGTGMDEDVRAKKATRRSLFVILMTDLG